MTSYTFIILWHIIRNKIWVTKSLTPPPDSIKTCYLTYSLPVISLMNKITIADDCQQLTSNITKLVNFAIREFLKVWNCLCNRSCNKFAKKGFTAPSKTDTPRKNSEYVTISVWRNIFWWVMKIGEFLNIKT